MYRASNGIMSTELSEAEAREHYDRAQYVSGEFGDTFVTCPVGEYGHRLSVAATTYTPICETPETEIPERETPESGETGWKAGGRVRRAA